MTLEVYNTNNGIPMGKAQLGGGGAESDGALYQYMGSVATYAALELLDTTDFKPGYVYDVQEDGMDYAWTGEAWNALGTHTDLSNYYNKTEVDALIAPLATKNELSGKQDKLTANNPLTISEYVMTSLVNMEYNSAGTGFYNSNTTSACQYLDFGYPGKVLFKQRSGQTLTTSNLYDIGHVDIPYQIGQLVAVKVLDESNESVAQTRSMIFGKTNSQGDFIPILYMDNTYSTATLTIGITTDDNISSLTALATGKYTTSQTWNTSLTSSTSYVTNGSTSSTTMGGYVRIYETSNGIQILLYNGMAFRVYGKSEVYMNSKAITTASLVSRLKEITMVRVIPNEYMGISDATAILKTGIGLFNSNLTSFNDFKTTKKTFADLGTNLFDLSGEVKQTYLDLNIGAGLDVQNNVLVNTNPTAPDMTNYYNKTQTDGLLDEKQDKLTPNAPLTISKYTKSNLNGMVHNTDGTTIYTDPSTGSTFRGLYTYYAGGTTLIALTSLPNYFPSSNIPSLHDFYEQVGYVDIPYSMGYIVNTSNLQSNGFGSFTLGKVLNGEYIQILAFRYGGGSDYPWQWLVNISDETPTVVRTDNYYGAARITTSQSSGNFTTSKTNCSDALGTLTQIIDNTTSISVRFKIGSYLWTYTFTDAQLCTRIREIDTVRIFASYDRGYDVNTAFQVSSIGLYNTDMQITGDETSYTPWGENLFDISGEQSYNYLDLHIGSGLSVDGNGNLVNTNPTPVDVSNKVTGVGISEMQALTQTEYDEIGKYYAYEYNGTTVYVRKETPTTTDTVYSAIGTASALTITSVGADSLTLSDGNTYTRSAASDEIDDTQYDATTLYVVKNVVGE